MKRRTRSAEPGQAVRDILSELAHRYAAEHGGRGVQRIEPPARRKTGVRRLRAPQ